MRTLLMALLLMVLTACSPASQPPSPTLTPAPPAETAWGAASRLAQAPSFHSPALISDKTGFIAAAFTLDGDVWRLTLYHDDIPITTSITARNPFALSLYPATQGGLFAVWLDYTGGQGSQLYVAHLTDSGDSELGALRVTDSPAVRFSATPTPDGRLWLVWSAAPIPESVVVVSQIDGLGRPRTPARLVGDADYPVLSRADGRTWLYWLTASEGTLYRAELTETQTLGETTRLSDGLTLDGDDVLIGLSIGADATTGYAFWQVLRHSAQPQVWWTAGRLTAERWEAPRPLSIVLDPLQSDASTGFNTGTTQSARLGDSVAVDWLSPASGQSDSLPTAVAWADGLGMVYWKDGAPFSSQRLTDSPRLIAPPAVTYDAERDLTLAWWEVLNEQAAQLTMIYSRR